jgi:hypothetical protein
MRMFSAIVLCCVLLGPRVLADGEWYVGPAGETGNPGTAESPWDIASTLGGGQKVAPGDTVYLLEGTYRRRPNEQFDVRLAGTAERPIHVRPAPGHRVRIDGGLAVHKPSSHVWIRDLEIFVSEPQPEKPVSAGSHPADLKRPWGGLHLHGGRDCKYINLVIHHCNQGISAWKDEINPEIYGCVIFGNGWLGVDRGHGHAIYTQNDEGVKTISNCIMTCPYPGSYTMHAYGSSRAYVNNYLLTENICYGRGPFLVGGGRPSHGIRVLRNYLHGVDMRIGYNAPVNEDCEIRDNVVVNGRLETVRYRKVVWEGNLILATPEAPRTLRGKAVLLPNRYDSSRAHIAVFRWDKSDAVDVPVRGFLSEGDAADLFDPANLWGEPVVRVVCRSGVIRVPVPGEFAVFVARASRR